MFRWRARGVYGFIAPEDLLIDEVQLHLRPVNPVRRFKNSPGIIWFGVGQIVIPDEYRSSQAV